MAQKFLPNDRKSLDYEGKHKCHLQFITTAFIFARVGQVCVAFSQFEKKNATWPFYFNDLFNEHDFSSKHAKIYYDRIYLDQ